MQWLFEEASKHLEPILWARSITNSKISILPSLNKDFTESNLFCVCPIHNWFSELFIHEGRLITFFVYWGMSIKYFRGNIFKFSPGRTFWRDNSSRRSTTNDALSKWLNYRYWMILGLCFIWKTSKTVNVNLWEARQTCLKSTWRMKAFWVVCQNVVDICWVF